MKPAPSVLFLCVANSARSQLAEALARRTFGDAAVVQSAGSAPARVHPLALAVLAEDGIDWTHAASKSVDDLAPAHVDLVVTLCAQEVCPAFLGGARQLHVPLADPAASEGEPSERMAAFRAARDEIVRTVLPRVAREIGFEEPPSTPR